VSRVKRRNLFLAKVTATGLLTGALLLTMALCTVGSGVAYADNVITPTTEYRIWLPITMKNYGAYPDSVIAATVRPSPLSVAVSSAPGTVFVGDRFQIKAKIENLGAEPISEVVATIHLPGGLILLSNTTEQSLGTIRKPRSAHGRLQADAEGNYIVQVSVTGRDEAGYLLAKEGSTLVEVREPPDRGRWLFWRLVSMLRSNWPLGNYAHAG